MLRIVRLVVIAAMSWLAVGPAGAADEPTIANRWALLVGVDDYAYAQKLKYCSADQLALSKQLIESGFPDDQVFLLHDGAENVRLRPSLGNINRQLDLVLSLADKNDLIVIGFSGHGVHLNGKSFLCPADCTLDDPATLIPVDGIYDRLKECAATFKLVVVDACRNDPRPGGSRSMTATAGTRALGQALKELKLPEGVVLLNSCAPGEVSWEDEEFGHGVFMHYVLDGLAGAADADGDGSVSLNELQAHAGGKTKVYVAHRFAVPQRPFFRGDLTTEALEYALLPVPGGGLPKVDRFDKSRRGYLGVYQLNSEAKPLVWHVEKGSPAEAAGIQIGDVLTSIGGEPVVNAGEVVAALRTRRPGDELEIVCDRNGRATKFDVVIEARYDDLAFQRSLAEAEAGSATAMVLVGQDYRYGTNSSVKQDEREALRWLRRGAEAGDALAMFELATMYAEGTAVTKDDVEAVRWLEQASKVTGLASHEGVCGRVAATLCDCYLNGRGVAKDLRIAMDLWHESAELGNARAQWSLGTRYRDAVGVTQSYARAFELFRESAAMHFADAENSLGYLYMNGQGVQADDREARVWYERAVDHGNVLAEVNLALLCELGRGAPRDLVRAVSLFRSAADKGNAMAMRNLGHCYRDGKGVPIDYGEALKWFKAAADAGDYESESSIGFLYSMGLGVKTDQAEARRWYESAVEKGSSAAANNLGVLYRDGLGVTQDFDQAMQYFLIAAKSKNSDAELSIGALIHNGQGVQRDLAQARGWYEAAAGHGHPQAMYNLGVMLENGEGGPKNVSKAYEWFRKAADLGNTDAKLKLQ